MILIISAASDAHAVAVSGILAAREAKHRMLDLSRFPQSADLSIELDGDSRKFAFQDDDGRIDLDECRVIWWRRPQPFGLHPTVTSDVDRNFAYMECQAAFAGIWLSLDAFWINHPVREDEASRKVYQLNLARNIGLKIPETCVTNDPDRARSFIRRLDGNVIYKAFGGTEDAWRETRRLKSDEKTLIDSVKFAPVIFQECVPGGVDLRITIIGDQIYCGAIYSNDASYDVDFRMVMEEVRMESFDLPEGVCDQLLELMKLLDLSYGAIDMRLAPNGEFFFLEINPSGQWLFVEYGTGLRIADQLATFMIERDRAKRSKKGCLKNYGGYDACSLSC